MIDSWSGPDPASRIAIDPLLLIQRVADQALEMIAGAEGVLVGMVVAPDALRYVAGTGNLCDHIGEVLHLDHSLSGEAIRSGRTLLTHDTDCDPRVNRRATQAHRYRSSVCVPLHRRGEPVGVLNVNSATTHAFDDHDVTLLSGLADFMSAVIGAAADFSAITANLLRGRSSPFGEIAAAAGEPETDAEIAGQFVANVLNPEGAKKIATHAEIERVLHACDFSVVFQPIFTLDRGGLFGVEALARFPDAQSEAPDVWLARAHEVGLGVDLEVAIVESVIAKLDQLPRQALLTVNAGPSALACGRITEALAGVDPGRIVVELTEQIKVDDYPHLACTLRGLRDSGVRLAIDDAGAGFASLMHILKLAPDYIKLDRELISGIDIDPVRRSLADSLRRFADETGAVIIAEGIETVGELQALHDLGASHGQGFYLARPAPVGELARVARRGSTRARPGAADRSSGAPRRRRRAALALQR